MIENWQNSNLSVQVQAIDMGEGGILNLKMHINTKHSCFENEIALAKGAYLGRERGFIAAATFGATREVYF